MSDVETNFYGDTVECVNHLSGRRFVGSKSDHKKIRFLAGQAKEKSDTLLDFEQPKYSNVREQIAENQRLAGLRIPTHSATEDQLNEPPKPRLTQKQIELLSKGNIRDQRQRELDTFNAYHSAKAADIERKADLETLAKRTAEHLAGLTYQSQQQAELDQTSVDIHEHWRKIDEAVSAAKENYARVSADKTSTQEQREQAFKQIWAIERQAFSGAASEPAADSTATEPATAEGGE